MKKYTKEELAEKAEGYFEQHPSVDKFIATEDGMFFTNESFAKNHNSTVVKGELVEIKRSSQAVEEAPVEESKGKKAKK